MANNNPAKARQAKQRKRLKKVGDIHDLRRKLWEAVDAASEMVRTATDDAVRLRAVHAVTQAATGYTKLIEATEFDARLRALEEASGT